MKANELREYFSRVADQILEGEPEGQDYQIVVGINSEQSILVMFGEDIQGPPHRMLRIGVVSAMKSVTDNGELNLSGRQQPNLALVLTDLFKRDDEETPPEGVTTPIH